MRYHLGNVYSQQTNLRFNAISFQNSKYLWNSWNNYKIPEDWKCQHNTQFEEAISEEENFENCPSR